MRAVGLAFGFALGACSADAVDTGLAIESVVPPYGSLTGGTTIVIHGKGFAAGAPNRVVIAGHEAPLASVVDDTRLAVVVPGGDTPGDAEVVVFNRTGTAQATHLFRYSTTPEITMVSPAKVVYTSVATTVTLTGTGFRDEGAGAVKLVVDGQEIPDVTVVDDSTLTFIAPPGQVLTRPAIALINDRGIATRERAYRYAPSERGGLLLFPPSGPFAIFYDPVDHTTIAIPQATPSTSRFTSVVMDERGDLFGFDRAQRFGRIDVKTHQLVNPLPTQLWLPAVERVGNVVYGINRYTLQIGVFDPATGTFAGFAGAQIACCGSFGIAADGPTLYFTSRSSTGPILNTLDPTTGTIGTPVPLIAPTGFAVEELRVFDHTLYASSRTGAFVTIDPQSGMTSALPVSVGRANAIVVLP